MFSLLPFQPASVQRKPSVPQFLPVQVSILLPPVPESLKTTQLQVINEALLNCFVSYIFPFFFFSVYGAFRPQVSSLSFLFPSPSFFHKKKRSFYTSPQSIYSFMVYGAKRPASNLIIPVCQNISIRIF